MATALVSGKATAAAPSRPHCLAAPLPLGRTDGPSVWRAEKGRRRRESGWNGTEWMEGVLPPPSLSPSLLARLCAARTTALSGRPPSGAAAAAHLSGTGPRGGRKEDEDDDRGEEDGRRNEGRSRGGGLSPPLSEESNRGAERRGKSKPTKLLLLPSRLSSLLLSSTLLTSPPHAPLSPPLPCGASFVLPPFLPANYIIYAAIHGMKEIHSRRRISKLRGVETGPPLTRREIFPGSHTRARASRRGDGWMPKEPFSSMTDRSSLRARSLVPWFFRSRPSRTRPH